MQSEKIFSCPRCSNFFMTRKMRKVRHPKGIWLDVCDNCGGMWVDGNEIDSIMKRYSQKSKKMSKKKK